MVKVWLVKVWLVKVWLVKVWLVKVWLVKVWLVKVWLVKVVQALQTKKRFGKGLVKVVLKAIEVGARLGLGLRSGLGRMRQKL